MSSLQIIQGEDWYGLYIDEKLVYEGHSVPLHVLEEHVPNFVVNELTWKEDAHLTRRGSLPETLTELEDRTSDWWKR